MNVRRDALLLLGLVAIQCGTAKTSVSGYIDEEVAFYTNSVLRSVEHAGYVARMAAPMEYLASLDCRTNIDTRVRTIVGNADDYLIMLCVDPHDDSGYTMDIFVRNRNSRAGLLLWHHLQWPSWNCSVTEERPRELLEWPIAMVMKNTSQVSGAYIPLEGDDMQSFYLTTCLAGATNRCGALWNLKVNETTIAGKIGLAALLIQGLSGGNLRDSPGNRE